jgi:hypothetical protein
MCPASKIVFDMQTMFEKCVDYMNESIEPLDTTGD